MRGPTGTSTLDEHERRDGVLGPAPLDEHTEIRWARMGAREVVVKAACDPHRSGLRREAEVLQRIIADGRAAGAVVAFVELLEGTDHTELATLRHGTVTLADVGLLSPTERTSALVSLCDALDDLHRAGWAHGSLDATHVLVDPAQATEAESRGATARGVRFCSLGDADQVRDGVTGTSRSADLQAVAGIVLDALEKPGGFGTRSERRRYQAAARKAHKRLSAARGLHDGHAVAQILRETIGRSTSRRRRAKSRVAGERRAASTDRRAGRRSAGRPRRWGTWPVAGALVASLALGATAAWVSRDDGGISADCTVELAGDEHSCGDVTVNGNVVTVAGQRFELGASHDIVSVGDWDCDGTGTAVLLEAGTGRLFHFATWSTTSEVVSGELIGTFEGATDLIAGEPCRYPEVKLADGSAVSPLERSTSDPDETG